MFGCQSVFLLEPVVLVSNYLVEKRGVSLIRAYLAKKLLG